MKKLVLLSIATLLCSSSFASSQLARTHSDSLNAMANAWKAKQIVGNQVGMPVSKSSQHLIYGGADVSPRTTLVAPSDIA